MQIKFNSYGYFYTFKNAQARSTGGGGLRITSPISKRILRACSAQFGFDLWTIQYECFIHMNLADLFVTRKNEMYLNM